MWAAQHLIQGAQVEEGMRAASVLLAELGLPLAASDGKAMLRIALEQARIAVGGKARALEPRTPNGEQRLVLEALHGLSSPVRSVSYLSGSLLVMQYLRRALAAGDPTHAARALAYKGVLEAVSGPKGEPRRLFQESRTLADKVGDPALVAEVELTRGLGELASCEFKRAEEHLSFAHELLTSRCPGQPWLLTATRMYLGSAWMYLGEYRTIGQHCEAWLAEARAKEDRYALAALSGFGGGSLRLLLADRPDEALAELEAAMSPWPKAPITTNHFGAFFSTTHVLGYKGTPEFAQWSFKASAELEGAFLMRTPAFKTFMLCNRVVATLHEVFYRGAKPNDPLLHKAEQVARALGEVRNGLAPGLAQISLAWVRLYQGHPDQSLNHARAARRSLAGTGQGELIELLESQLEGGEGGRAKAAAQRARLTEQGFRNPERALNFMFPKLEFLMSQR
jgi:tetratricopeptide (TPR) repeat protein